MWQLKFLCVLFLFSNSQVGNCQTLKFSKSYSTDSLQLNLINFLGGPVNVVFEAKQESHCLRFQENVVIDALDTLHSVIAIPFKCIEDTVNVKWADFFSVKAQLGDPNNSVHDDNQMYLLPFKKGKSYKVIQSWNGKFSHRSKSSKYAIDFQMPIGDTICAARKGLVVRTQDEFKENGGEAFINKANQVVVLHDDGTLAYYVHLSYKGVLVRQGDNVEAGQAIGLSGNTGYSSKPHLHFVVREAPDTAVPVYFKGYQGVKLKTRKTYKNKI